MAYTISQLADLVNLTQDKYKRHAWTDISLDLQRYHAFPELMKEENYKEDGGEQLTFFVQTDTGNNTRPTALFDQDIININDQSSTASIPWRHITTNASWDIREPAINSGDSKLVDVILVRQHGMWNDWAKRCEEYFWALLAADDGLRPFGLPYYVVRHASTGFYGNQPWSGTNCAGLSHANWRNYTSLYTNITKDDLIDKMSIAIRKCEFTPPVPHKDLDQGPPRRVFYTNLATLRALEKLGEGQNENLGRDLVRYQDEITFRGHPIRWAPYFDGAGITYAPIYGLDWSKLYFTFLSGWDAKQTAAEPVAGQHTVVAQHVDATFNLCCHDRRAFMVLATSAS